MGDFLRTLLDFLKEAWPFRRIEQYEHGVYSMFGRYWKTVGPGVWPVIPWFMDVDRVVTCAQVLASAWRQDITTQSGEMVSFEFVAEYRVFDANLARNAIFDYEQSTSTVIRAVLADRLASVDPERLEPKARGRLLSDLRRWADEETQPFGIEVQKVRFASFVTNVRTYRFLGGDPR